MKKDYLSQPTQPYLYSTRKENVKNKLCVIEYTIFNYSINIFLNILYMMNCGKGCVGCAKGGVAW
jgi:hypothetical protein